MSRLTSSQLQEVGFSPCSHPPHGWQYAGDVYVQHLPKGSAYVLCIEHSEEVEAFIGDWMNPLAYFYWPAADTQKLSGLLHIAQT
ncbi:hypothetical protein MTX78_13215 [Hymenobacter tibetensis]|uniref:DUF3303 domain-containing protein n=1 Tax=Hymenobacter tibetensis TaxID=497967 RepID=A0ABY4CS66_9BACT|nr:hypothetical protein [Hymenobacter tibetensis]UOG73084.1 hypothetical protein MTX78_13215 [Hymenobacter tibetensis]